MTMTLEKMFQKSRIIELYGDPPRTERINWRERLLSWPWRPWVSRKPSPWAEILAKFDKDFEDEL